VTPIPPPLRRQFLAADGRTGTSLLEFAEGASLDPQGVADLLAWGHPVGATTLLAGVSWVSPGPWALSPPDPHPSTLSDIARADALWGLLRDAVSRAIDGRRLGVSLSGGLDSRAVAAAAVSLRGRALTLATFGDPGAVDLGRARMVARRLDAPHVVSVLPLEAALMEEGRVFAATGGLGGPASAPGAFTDASWADDFDLLLSGMSGDVIWGDTRLRGPSPASRLRKLGVAPARDPVVGVPEPPPWTTPASVHAWENLWTRQARVTWNGLLSRRQEIAVVPVLWDPALLSFCLALDGVDRADRALLRAMFARHAPAVDPAVVPPVSGPVHDLDRAMCTSEDWQAELDAMMAFPEKWAAMGLKPRAVGRILRLVRNGKRPRSGLVSRLRVLWSWAWRLGL